MSEFEIKLGEGEHIFIVESRPPLTNCESLNDLDERILPSSCYLLNDGQSQAFVFPRGLFKPGTIFNDRESQRNRFVYWVEDVLGRLSCKTVIDPAVQPLTERLSLF